MSQDKVFSHMMKERFWMSCSLLNGKNYNTCLCPLMTTNGILQWGVKWEHKYIFLHHCSTSRTNILIFLPVSSSRTNWGNGDFLNNKWLMKIRKIFLRKEFLVPSAKNQKISNKQVAAMCVQEFLLMHKRKLWVLFCFFLMFTGNFEAI